MPQFAGQEMTALSLLTVRCPPTSCRHCVGDRALSAYKSQELNGAQLNRPVRQQAQVPMVVALGGRATGQSNQVGLGSVIHLAVPVVLRPVLEHPVQHAPGEAPLDIEHCTQVHIQGLGHLGAGQPSSVFSRMRARVVTRAEPLPARTKYSSWLRSSGVSLTPYLSLTIPPPHSNIN